MLDKLQIIKASFLLFLILFSSSVLFAQEKVITGIVTDASTGETLIGVNVTFAYDLGQGTVTDIDGRYQLSVPDTLSALRFSYVGYSTQVVPVTATEINVQLMGGEELDEVVVVGYGTQKTKEVTSAITRVKAEDFNNGNINNPIQLIQGRVAGVSISRPGGDPNSSFDVRIRGLSTFGANTEPLIIIDGVQGTTDLMNSLDPDDVASFDVLKDASAAAIYGTKAASGVIIITTKKGEFVPGEEKPFQLEFNASLTTESIANGVDVLTADEYRQIEQSTDYFGSTNWMDEISQTGLQQAYNLAANGATKTSRYRVSMNYRSASGVVRETGFDQLNGRLNFTQTAFQGKVTFDFNLAGTIRNETYTADEAMRFLVNYNPTAPVMATTDSLDAFSQQWGGYFQRQAFDFYNPVAIVEQGTLDGKKTRILGSLKGTWEIIDGLKASLFYSADQASELYGDYWQKAALWTPYGTATGKGYARKEDKDIFKQIFELTGTYEKRWENFGFSVMGGYSWQQQLNEEFWAFGEGFLTDGFTYNNLGGAQTNLANKETMYSYKSERLLVGFFARASFTILNGIYVTGSFRRDGSSMFGENNKWGNFPAVSAGIDLAKFVDLGIFNQLKFRGGYGITGNLPPEPYLSQDRWNVSDEKFFYNGEFIQAYEPVRNANPDLQWETKAEFDVGVDFYMWDYRISGSIDYYQSDGSDLLLEFQVRVPPNAADRTWYNVGELRSSGIEFALNWDIFKKQKWGWTTGFNFTNFFDTKLINITSDLVDSESTIYLGDLGAPYFTNTTSILANEGDAIGAIIAPRYLGIDTANYMYYYVNDTLTTTVPTDTNRFIAGYGLPDFEFGWGNSFYVGKFNISFFLRGVFGHSIVNLNNARYGNPNTIGIQSGMGQTLDFVGVENGPIYSDVHVEKADFVTLDNFSLGYQFDFPESNYLSHVTLYFSGQNLFTITNYSGVSPEARYYDEDVYGNRNPLAPGIDRGNTYFRTRSFTLGVKVAF